MQTALSLIFIIVSFLSVGLLLAQMSDADEKLNDLKKELENIECKEKKNGQ